MSNSLTFKGYKDFSCFTDAANRAMANHCQTFIRKINKSLEAGDNSVQTRRKFKAAMKAYINSYRRLCRTQTGDQGGCIDTAVRESVWATCQRIGNELNYNFVYLDEIWEETYANEA